MTNKGQSKIVALMKWLTAGLLLVCGSVQADECAFGEKGEGGTSTIINTTAGAPVYFKYTDQEFPEHFIEIGGPYEAQLSPALWSSCRLGNDGHQMSNITYDAGGTSEYAMWPTNLSGIYYAVRVYSDTSSGSYFQQSFGQWENLPVQSTTASHNWKVQIKLFQSQSYLGNPNGITTLTPEGNKKIGGMAIGDHNDSNNKPWWFEVTPASFSIPILAPTCQAAMVNGGSNNVDFGEQMFSSIREGHYPSQAFTLQLKGCNNVVAINYRVTSNTTNNISGTFGLLLNTLTSNAAAGVGVGIDRHFPTNQMGSAQYINDPTYVYTPLADVGYSQNIDLPFSATMRRDDSSPLKPGDFRAIATFTIDYL